MEQVYKNRDFFVEQLTLNFQKLGWYKTIDENKFRAKFGGFEVFVYESNKMMFMSVGGMFNGDFVKMGFSELDYAQVKIIYETVKNNYEIELKNSFWERATKALSSKVTE